MFQNRSIQPRRMTSNDFMRDDTALRKDLNDYLPTYAPHGVFAQHGLAARIRTGPAIGDSTTLGRKGTRICYDVLICSAAC